MPAAPTPPPPALSSGSARDRVTEALAAHAATYPDLSPLRLDERNLAPRDAALMHAIYDAAVRRWGTIESLISTAASRPAAALDPFARAALLAGAAQILFLDRIPDHAAIHESVEWAKTRRGRGAAGLVNAILRKVCSFRALTPAGERITRPAWDWQRDELPLSDGRALELSQDLLPEPVAKRLGIAGSISPWLADRWLARLGMEEAARLAWHSLASAPVILNAIHATKPIDFPLAAGGALTLHPHQTLGHYTVEGPHAALTQLLDDRPDIWVQDPSSSAAIESIRDSSLAPALILDLCAGQGTKTRQLAAAFPSARIIATDTDSTRYETLSRQFHAHRQVTVVPPSQVRQLAPANADLILLDVPCSNTGVLARRLEARHRAGPQQLSRLTRIQSQIIADAVPLLAPHGQILYATCSLEPEENHLLLADAAALGLAITHQRSTAPAGGPGLDATSYTDGSFSALLSKQTPAQ
ncbi:MAG: hypothetical protein IT435_01390 [Phycisphaerales bacterium]|nr:hypothetical protein [Phycisphaerales bacterium]